MSSNYSVFVVQQMVNLINIFVQHYFTTSRILPFCLETSPTKQTINSLV